MGKKALLGDLAYEKFSPCSGESNPLVSVQRETKAQALRAPQQGWAHAASPAGSFRLREVPIEERLFPSVVQ